MVINIELRLQVVTFEKDEELKNYIETFHFLISELASYRKYLLCKEKLLKFLWTVWTRFELTELEPEESNVSFDKVNAIVKFKIFALESTWCRKAGFNSRPICRLMQKSLEDIVNRRLNKIKGELCVVFGKLGHFANRCWNGRAQIRGGFGRSQRRGICNSGWERIKTYGKTYNLFDQETGSHGIPSWPQCGWRVKPIQDSNQPK